MKNRITYLDSKDTEPKEFYILSAGGDNRLRFINIDTNISNEQPSFNCKFENNLNGLIDAINAKKELEKL